jgi:hypothetical protein
MVDFTVKLCNRYNTVVNVNRQRPTRQSLLYVGLSSFANKQVLTTLCTRNVFAPSNNHNKVSIHWHKNQQTMTEPSLTTLLDINTIGDRILRDNKWSSFVDGGDGFLYGIPSNRAEQKHHNKFYSYHLSMRMPARQAVPDANDNSIQRLYACRDGCTLLELIIVSFY